MIRVRHLLPDPATYAGRVLLQPFDSAAITAYRSKADWDALVEDIFRRHLNDWHLQPLERHHRGRAALVADVRQGSGELAVIKVSFPHEEAIYEAVALGAFPPEIAPAVLRQDVSSWAMLLERVRPGTALGDAALPPTEALAIGGTVLAHIAAYSQIPDQPMLRVADFALTGALTMGDSLHRHADVLARLRIPVAPIREAAEELDRLGSLVAPVTLVHGDANPGNFLLDRSGDDRSTGRWRVIDPKGMVGDPAYDLWPLVTQLGDPLGQSDPASVLADQLNVAAAAAGCDPARAARWGFARAGQSLLWFLDDDDQASALREAEVMLAWRDVAAP